MSKIQKCGIVIIALYCFVSALQAAELHFNVFYIHGNPP